MNPMEIYQFIVTLIREHGPEVLAAFVLGLAGGVWFLWQIGLVGGTRAANKKVADLNEKIMEAEHKIRTAEGELAVARSHLADRDRELDRERTNLTKLEKKQEGTKTELADIRTDRDNKLALLKRYAQKIVDERNKSSDLETGLTEQTHLLGKRTDELKATTTDLQKTTTHLQKARADTAHLGTAVKELKDTNQRVVAELTKTHNDQVEEFREVEARKIAHLSRHLDETSKRVGHLDQANEDLERKIGELQTAYETEKARADAQLLERRELRDALDSIARQSGKVWESPSPASAPPFVPLGKDRRCPIISVLNLKGGVGKTTITLNLAAALSDQGKHVLLVDCDFQRSLTNLCLTMTRRNELQKAGRTLQQYLLGPGWTEASFLRAVCPLPNMNQCSIVANTRGGYETEGEGLASVEEKVMLDWLLPPQPKPDIRFALRVALHSQAIYNQYDYVLLDCPPRISTACINAIAASDFIVIPILLDELAGQTPLLHVLNELKKLRDGTYPNFDILGVVANRLTGAIAQFQSDIWSEMADPAKKVWEKDVYFCDTMIRQAVVYAQATSKLLRDSDSAVAIWRNAEANKLFSDLVLELQGRIASETPCAATVPS